MREFSATEQIKEILEELLEVVSEIEKRTVENPSENYTLTPIKKKINEIGYSIRRI